MQNRFDMILDINMRGTRFRGCMYCYSSFHEPPLFFGYHESKLSQIFSKLKLAIKDAISFLHIVYYKNVRYPALLVFVAIHYFILADLSVLVNLLLTLAMKA